MRTPRRRGDERGSFRGDGVPGIPVDIEASEAMRREAPGVAEASENATRRALSGDSVAVLWAARQEGGE